jgi:hypothetical protein
MTTNEIITELLKYDGYTFIETVTDGYFIREEDQEGHEDIFTYIDLEEYITDLNILHRVAVKVLTQISEILDNSEDLDFDLASVNNTVCSAMFQLPINGEYITLATATADAIVYLKKYKV